MIGQAYCRIALVIDTDFVIFFATAFDLWIAVGI